MRELTTLKSIAERLNGLAEIHGALDDVLGLLVQLLGLQTAWLFLIEGDHFVPAGTHGLPPALACGGCAALSSGTCSCQELFLDGKLTSATNIVQCSRLRRARGDKGGLVYHASVPLVSQGERTGILNVAAPGRELFTDETLALLLAVGLQIATAIERSRLYQRERRMAQLEARQRLAADLHDAASQALFSLVMTVQAARQQLEHGHVDHAVRSLQQADAMARGALSEMRGLVFDLRRNELTTDGLLDTLQRYIEAQPLLRDLEIELAVDADPEPELAETAFRIVQEGLNNVIKHADARRVRVAIAAHPEKLYIEISDDGRGFDPQETAPGFGRRFLRERCERLGGRFGLESSPGGGARLWAELPLEKAAGQEDPS